MYISMVQSQSINSTCLFNHCCAAHPALSHLQFTHLQFAPCLYQGPITALAVGRHPAAPQHSLLFAGTKDGSVSVWNADSGARLQLLPSVHCLGRRRGATGAMVQ